MKYIKTFEAMRVFFDRFDEYEKAKNSPEYKALIDAGYEEITSETERSNGTFSFRAPRGARYAIDRFYGGRINRNGRVFGNNTKSQPKSYEEAFTRLLKLKDRDNYPLNSSNYKANPKFFVEKLIQKLTKNATSILDIDMLPTIKNHPELETVYRRVYNLMLKNPLSYVPYFKFLLDGVAIFSLNNLSDDILDWFYEDKKNGKIDFGEIIKKIVDAVEKNPTKWIDNRYFDTLPEEAQEKLKWITRGKSANMWGFNKK